MTTSIRERAISEMARVGIPGDDARVISEILDKFFENFNSGGAVSVMAPVLIRLISGAPLSPLTGADDEWEDMSAYEDAVPGTIFQNRRDSSVFKRKVARENYTGVILRTGAPSSDDAEPDHNRMLVKPRDQIEEAVRKGEAKWEWAYFDVRGRGDGYNGHRRIEQFPYFPEPSTTDPLVTLPGSGEL